MKVACAAWTGIATTLMIVGHTVHGLFKLPVPVLENSTCQLQSMLNINLIIIMDEASMIPTHALHAMDRCLRDIMQNNQPFGGKTILLGGDFRQVLPVVPRVPPAVIIDTCLKRSPMWPCLKRSLMWPCLKHSPMWPLFEQHRLTCNFLAKVILQHGYSSMAMGN